MDDARPVHGGAGIYVEAPRSGILFHRLREFCGDEGTAPNRRAGDRSSLPYRRVQSAVGGIAAGGSPDSLRRATSTRAARAAFKPARECRFPLASAVSRSRVCELLFP